MTDGFQGTASISSINECLEQSIPEEEGSLMKEMKQKLAQIGNRYSNGEDNNQQKNVKDKYENQERQNENMQKFELISADPYASNSNSINQFNKGKTVSQNSNSDNKAYTFNKSQNEEENGNDQEKEKQRRFIEKMEKKLFDKQNSQQKDDGQTANRIINNEQKQQNSQQETKENHFRIQKQTQQQQARPQTAKQLNKKDNNSTQNSGISNNKQNQSQLSKDNKQIVNHSRPQSAQVQQIQNPKKKVKLDPIQQKSRQNNNDQKLFEQSNNSEMEMYSQDIQKLKSAMKKQKQENSKIEKNLIFEDEPLSNGDQARPIKTEKILTKKDPSQHWQMVTQILKEHEKKQKIMQQKEDVFYIREALEKMKPKQVKQNLRFEEEREKGWVDPIKPLSAGNNPVTDQPNAKKNQIQANQIMKDVGKNKMGLKEVADAKINDDPNKKQAAKNSGDVQNKKKQEKDENKEDQKTEKEGEEKKSNKQDKSWSYSAGTGVQTEKEKSQISKEKQEKAKENQFIKEQKERDRRKQQEFLEQQKELQKKAKEMMMEGQNNLKKDNKALNDLNDEAKKNKIDKKAMQDEIRNKELDEQDKSEIIKLKIQIRHLKEETNQIKDAINLIASKKKDQEKEIDQLMKSGHVIVLGDGKFTSFGLVPDIKDRSSTAATTDQEGKGDEEEEGSSAEKSKSKNLLNESENMKMTEQTPAEQLVSKIVQQDLTINQVYQMLDNDGDGVLTMTEIRQQMPQLNLQFEQEDIELLISIIDKNSDGVVNEEEFVGALEAAVKTEKEYEDVMGSDMKDIQNPIQLEERKLDLEMRKKVVEKKIVEEERQCNKREDQYAKVLAELKKYEAKWQKKEKLKKKPNIKEMQEKKNDFKKQLHGLEHDKDKLMLAQMERLALIEENIKGLTQELMSKSELVLKAKNCLSNFVCEYEKLQIKQLAIDQLTVARAEERRLRAEEEERQAQKRQANMRMKYANMEVEKSSQKTAQQSMRSAMFLQSIFRGWKARIETKKRKIKVKYATRVIAKYYRKTKKKRQFKKSLDIIIGKHWMLMNKAWIDLKQLYNQLKSQKKTTRQLLDEQQQIFQEEEKQKGDQKIMSEQEKKKLLEQQQNMSTFDVKCLPAVITLQRNWRKKKEIVPKKGKKMQFCFADLPVCCQMCNQNQVEIFCRSCAQAMLCLDCFKIYHQAFQRKNHKYYELKLDNYENQFVSDIERQQKIERTVYNAIKDDLQQLAKFLRYTDEASTGYLEFQKIQEVLINKTKLGENPNNTELIQSAQILCKKYIVENKEEVRKEFQKKQREREFLPKSLYVNYKDFLYSFELIGDREQQIINNEIEQQKQMKDKQQKQSKKQGKDEKVVKTNKNTKK